MLVELDVFSGRANPRWWIDDALERRLRSVEESLAPVPGPRPELPGLGYRGFRYSLDGVSRRAWNGTVSGSGGTLADPGRRVERLLLDALPAEYADVRERVNREVSRKP